MTDQVSGTSILITGGTGSFGSAMARRMLHRGCAEVRVLSRDEAKQDGMRRRFNDDRLRFYLGDVRDPAAVASACRGVEYVFHAAALKQVPSCEFFPVEAVRTNVLGSANVVEAARANGVRTVVCLSTDKAVYPANAMGMSKALMERVAQAYSRGQSTGDTVVCTVRYGNVLCSRGSVVPLFIEQVRNGVPLTVTDPRMTRFLMSMEDAIGLVERAFTFGETGDLFVRKAPASTVDILARAVARLFGVVPVVTTIGARHGEKFHETLVAREELARAEDHGEMFRIPLDAPDLDYHLYFDEGDEGAEPVEPYTSDNAEQLDADAVVKIFHQTPEIRALLEMGGIGG
ncbi:polysaccharide biosynthesis protein [Phytoactinopolyspora halotolerans]|uniref:UDP-glucose 4-epimerase n=1 Tax=Phytoactinopolyspora halotolerans TaxID=1981512 RepID=A0A6L9S513_9ACTN|nr:polysaccharide biosynthesis protein [Phytoactinopolyspora halotolerans]NEE00189.1 polysaccharide biosynthesis protein [Phytoactinopolyspora halotolerans]